MVADLAESDAGSLMQDYFVLNELQLPRLVAKILKGRKPVILDVWPLLRGNRNLLDRLRTRLIRKGLLTDPFELRPDWRRFIEKQGGTAAYGFYTDAYMKLEPTQDKLFGMADLGRRLPDYGQAVRHRIATHYTDLHWLTLALRDLEPGDRVYGMPSEIEQFARAYADNEPARYKAVRSLRLGPLFNTGYLLLALAYSLSWVVRRIVLRRRAAKRYQLGADLLQVLRHLYVTREMVDSDDQCLIVFRTPEFQRMYRDQIGGIDHCLVTDGCVPLAQTPAFLAMAVMDHIRLCLTAFRWEPTLYQRIASLAHWRIVYRAG